MIVASPDTIKAAEATLVARHGVAVMRHAGFATAQTAMQILRSVSGRSAGRVAGRRVLVAAGPGGNGGDARVAAEFLRGRGVAAKVCAPGEVAEAAAGSSWDLVIDGLLGLQMRLPLGGAFAEAVAAINSLAARGVPVLSIDVPTGLNPATGESGELAVRADVTVVFGVAATGVAASADMFELVSHDVGFESLLADAPARLLRPEALDRWPVPGPKSHKYTGGVCGIYAGSDEFPGAGVLCTGAAVMATSSSVRYLGTSPGPVLAAYPTALAVPGPVDCVVVGPGFRPSSLDFLPDDVACIIDASALEVLRPAPDGANWVITPHAGEIARLGARGTRVEQALWAARHYRVTCVLKGAVTIIATPTGQLTFVPAVNNYAATPGSGDVLAGLMGAFVAAHPTFGTITDAVIAAVQAHALLSANFAAPRPATALIDAIGDVAANILAPASTMNGYDSRHPTRH